MDGLVEVPRKLTHLGAFITSPTLQYFNNDRLHLKPSELTYADRIFSSARVLDAVCLLLNDVSVDPSSTGAKKASVFNPLNPVKPEHLVIGSGATGILDQLFWALCEPNDGVLLSTPYYNGFVSCSETVECSQSRLVSTLFLHCRITT